MCVFLYQSLVAVYTIAAIEYVDVSEAVCGVVVEEIERQMIFPDAALNLPVLEEPLKINAGLLPCLELYGLI